MATICNILDSKQPTREIDLIGPRVEFLIPPTCGTLSVMRSVFPAGVVVPLHSHADVEAFYTTTGQLQIYSEKANDWIAVKSNEFVYIPGDEKHAWRNVSDEDATMLLITTAKMGSFFEEIGMTISGEDRVLPPSPE